jgi:hypothetical protein
MIRRPLLAAALMTAAILPVALSMPAAAKKKAGVKFGTKSVTPKTVPGNNPTVNVSVVVTPSGGATVSGVTVRSVRSGGPGATSAMTAAGTKWTKNGLQLPANTTGKDVNVDIWADANTSAGKFSTKIGTVKQGVSVVDPNSPPPPPPI